MARLPVPGGDDGTWGSVLNSYLSVSHNTDGSLANNSVGNGQLKTGAVDNSKIAASASISQSKIANLSTDLASKLSSTRTINTGTGLTGGGDLSADRTISATSATSSSLGVIQLAGDLGGSATAPTVPGLSSKISSSEKGVANGVAQLDGTGKIIPGQLVTSNITKVLPFSFLGGLTTFTGALRLYNDMGSTWTISGVRASVGTAPVGAAIIIDINKNGNTIFTTQANRPTIADSTNTSGNVTAIDINTVAPGEYLTIDVDQIGATTAGTDLTIQVEVM